MWARDDRVTAGVSDVTGATDAAEVEGAAEESAAWKQLSSAATLDQLAHPWLDLVVDQAATLVPGVLQGVVVLGLPGTGPFKPAAFWPQGQPIVPAMARATELAMEKRRGVVFADDPRDQESQVSGDPEPRFWLLAWPVLIDRHLLGVVGLRVEAYGPEQLQGVMRQLQWAVPWLEVYSRRHSASTAGRDSLATALEMVTVVLEHERFQAAATALTTELATRLECERVGLGLVRNRRVQVKALSHSAHFTRKTNLMRAIGRAMEEAMDQHTSVVLPESNPALTVRAHTTLAHKHNAASVCTVLMTDNGRSIGALTLERPLEASSFDADTVALCEQLGVLVGPILNLKARDDRWISTKVWDSVRGFFARLLGMAHLGLKFWTIGLAVLSWFMVTTQVTYRVTADAVLEGAVQRSLVASMDGYIQTADARAGDIVSQGQELATLDDSQLRLEKLRWVSEREQYQRQYRNATAGHERAESRILAAQVAQAEAQITLLDERIARTRVQAPFDGILVSGDLSQSLGSPVERGSVLFEVAPLDAYRVTLLVDEHDIVDLVPGQQGQVVLSALPGRQFEFTLETITPVTVALEGRNTFRVTGELESGAEYLRPGMEGVGKVNVDQRPLIQVWTQPIVNWLRLWVWSWWP